MFDARARSATSGARWGRLHACIGCRTGLSGAPAPRGSGRHDVNAQRHVDGAAHRPPAPPDDIGRDIRSRTALGGTPRGSYDPATRQPDKEKPQMNEWGQGDKH